MSPEPTPRVNRPPVISDVVAAAEASDGTVQKVAGTTEMPVRRPPSTTSALADQSWVHIWFDSRPFIEFVQMLP